VLGLLTGLISLLAFALPPLFRLGSLPAVAIFRIDSRAAPLPGRVELVLAITGVVAILSFYTKNLLAVPILLAVLVLFGLLLVLPVGWLLSRFGRANMQVSGWKVLALSRIRRRLRINAFQVAVLAMALLLFVAMLGMRDNLFREWQAQLPEKTPNYFLVNIQQEEWMALASYLQSADIATETIYPMVRARLVEINRTPVSSLVSREELDRAGADRELNLSWSEALPADNTLVEGRWGGAAEEGASIEEKLAERLSIKLGDTLTFQSGSERFESRVTSIRTVEWDRMRPNFFLLLPRAQLERYPRTYMTSIYLPAERSEEVVKLLQQFPTTVVIELDGIIAQIRRIIDHAARALELVLLLVIVGTLLVLWATVQGSLAERLQENTVIRALGGTGRLITGSLFTEFLFLGLVAGVLATVGSELLLLVLQALLLDIPLSLHPGLWWVAPLAGSLLVGLAGLASAWRVIHTKPAELLREF
jgi:putative ABC transport system permease protein